MKKIFLSLLTAIALLVTSTTTRAVEPSDDAAVIVPMKKGQVAPREGVLLSTRAATQIAVELEAHPQVVKVEVEKAQKLERAQCVKELADEKTRAKAEKKTYDAIIAEREARLRILQKSLQEAEKNSKRPDVFLVATLGAAGGVFLTLGTVFLVGQATK